MSWRTELDLIFGVCGHRWHWIYRGTTTRELRAERIEKFKAWLEKRGRK